MEPRVRESRLTPLGRFTLKALLCCLLLFILLAWLGYFELGAGVAMCAGIVAGAVRPWWEHRRRVWLWGAIMVASAAQIPLIAYVPWSSHVLRGGVLLVFGLADYTGVYGIIWLAAKVFGAAGPIRPA